MIDQLREKRVHGSPVFPFECIRMQTDTNSLFVRSHWHDETEMIVMEQGSVELICDGVKYTLLPGDVAFINPQQLHQYTSMTDTVRYDACVFSQDPLLAGGRDTVQALYLEPIITGKDQFPQHICAEDPVSGTLRHFFCRMTDGFRKKDTGWELSVKICLFEILYTLIKNNRLSVYKGVERDAGICRTIHEYLEENLSRRISVNDVAAHICMSPNYFSAYFTRHFGRSFLKYLLDLRVERARIALLSTDASITEIAADTGFENTSYFIRRFKELSGCTPGEYRKQKKSRLREKEAS